MESDLATFAVWILDRSHCLGGREVMIAYPYVCIWDLHIFVGIIDKSTVAHSPGANVCVCTDMIGVIDFYCITGSEDMIPTTGDKPKK